MRFGSERTLGSNFSLLRSELSCGIGPSLDGGAEPYWSGKGKEGTGGTPALKSCGSCAKRVEYRRLTKSAVLSPCCGLSRGVLYLLSSALGLICDGKPLVFAIGTGALIFFGLIFLWALPGFFRRDFPLFSSIECLSV